MAKRAANKVRQPIVPIEPTPGGTEVASWRGRDGTAGGQVRKLRPNAWTDAHEREFLVQLSITANVKASAEAVGKSFTCAYKRRRKYPAFRQAWADALVEGYARLESELLDRALNGQRVVRVVRGEEVERVEVSNSLGLNLLRQHRRAVAEHRAAMGPAREDPKVVRARMAKLIDTLVGNMPDRPASEQIIDQPPADPGVASGQPGSGPEHAGDAR